MAKFLSSLSDSEIEKMVLNAVIENYPEQWHSSIFCEILRCEYKRVREKPEIVKNYCVTDKDGEPYTFILPEIEKIEYKGKADADTIYLKLIKVNPKTLKQGKIGYVSLSDFSLDFTNLILNEGYKKNKNLIASDFPQLVHKKDILHFNTSKEEVEQSKKAQQLYVTFMENNYNFGKKYKEEYETKNNFIADCLKK